MKFNINWEIYKKRLDQEAGEKHLVNCCVCGDVLFYGDNSNLFEDFGWYTIPIPCEPDYQRYICHQCSDHEYITIKKAKKEDKKNLKKYGSLLDKNGYPRRFSYTWDEQQEYIKEHKKHLKKYVKENYPKLYEDNKYMFGDYD